MTNLQRSPRQTYKALLFDYDQLLSKSDDESCYSLSEREVNLILAQLDYIGWKTRYRPTSTEIDRNVIDMWKGNLAQKLISALSEAPCGVSEFPTPFWDTGDDVNDEQPAETQEWYGEVTDASAPANALTFVENAALWTTLGFIAYSPAPVAPAAPAIFFRTSAPRFALDFSRGDVREVFRVVVDAADYSTVDTDDMIVDEVVQLSVDGLDEQPTHDIIIIRTE